MRKLLVLSQFVGLLAGLSVLYLVVEVIPGVIRNPRGRKPAA